MSTISSVSNYASSAMSQRMQRPDPAKMLDNLFSKLDTKSQGYLEKSDLQTAFSQLSSTSASGDSASVDEIFKQLDSDGNGKVTKDEMSSSLQKLAEQLDSQFDQMRMSGGAHAGGMPPPPPPGGKDDAGFTKEELQDQLSEIGSSDSTRSDLINTIVNNFDKADTDGDGKVSFKEAMAYGQSQGSATSSSSNDTSSTASTASTSSEQAIMKRIMELMHAYSSNDAGSAGLSGMLSVSA